MPSQLIYTSAPQGLAAGQSGYCTVARDGKLREALIRALEQLSSYNHAADTGQHNPVISAYRILDLRGAKYHVLSRIQDAGLDFTNRTNHLAHHLVFEPHELADLPSPALIFRDWNGWRKEWKEPPRLLGPSDLGNLAQLPRTIALPAKHWAGLTGDAGSAAGLLEPEFANGGSFLADSAELFLPLFAESVQLLALQGKAQAGLWQYTFTTRLQPEDNPNDFRWRGCQSNSPAYQAALRKGASFKPVNSIKAPANDLANCARTGKAPLPEIRLRTPAPPQPRPRVVPVEPRPTTPKPVPAKVWDRRPGDFEPEEDEAKAEDASQTRWLPWISLLICVVVALGGWAWLKSRKQQSGEVGQVNNPVATNVGVTAGDSPRNQPSGSDGTNPAPPRPGSSPIPPTNADDKWADRLPGFTTYLVGLASDGSGISVDTISALSNVCSQLKAESDLLSMNKIMECRVRHNDPVSIEESPTSSVVSFRLNNGNGELSGQDFSLEGWKTLKPRQDGITVMDFSSPQTNFGKFRIVTFPAGITNQPLKFPKSLLRENQTGVLASLEKSFASRIAKLEAVGSLQLRPFIKTSGDSKDLIDAMPSVDISATANGNELNFPRLRQKLTDHVNELSGQIDRLQKEINTLSNEIASLSGTIKAQEDECKKLPDDQEKRTALNGSLKTRNTKKLSLSSKAKGLADLQQRRILPVNSVAMVPADLKDPKLDHVTLVFVTTRENKPGDRIELIRFDDSEVLK